VAQDYIVRIVIIINNMRCFICKNFIKKSLQIHPRYTKNLINKPQFYCERDWQRLGKPKPEKVEGVKKFKEDLSDLKDVL